jgi:Rps23 Pro-64 3,4-dihydroxylase Tpa1-like proline 4-hydroxylase
MFDEHRVRFTWQTSCAKVLARFLLRKVELFLKKIYVNEKKIYHQIFAWRLFNIQTFVGVLIEPADFQLTVFSDFPIKL